MSHTTVATDRAPAAIGPYSQAVVSDGVLYSAGQVALDPATGTLVGETAAEQTEQVVRNLGAVLEEAGSGFDRVLRCTVYLVDMGDFPAVNEVYARAFSGSPPARSTVAVAALPLGARVEIDCIARVG